MSVRLDLYDRTNIHELSWPDTEYGAYAKAYIMPLILNSPEHYIRNVRTRILVAMADGIPVPVTVNEADYGNAYVCSPYTHYISYAKEELKLLGQPLAEHGLSWLLSGVGRLFMGARFNRVVQVNNWLVSTNLFPAISGEQLTAIMDMLRERFAGYAILIRSLNEITEAEALAAARAYGCKLIPSRQIYFLQPHDPASEEFLFPSSTSSDIPADSFGQKERVCPNHSGQPDIRRKPGTIPVPNARAKWLVKRDRSLLQKQGYQVAGPENITSDDVPRIARLYELLYIRKYSIHNPQFSEAFIHLAKDCGILKLYGLRKEGRLDAVLGFFAREGVMTTPLFGYDTGLPQSLGLYRMLSAVLIDLAGESGTLLHESSGVGQFKRNRGAVPALELSAVYDKHLPLRVRSCWSVLEKLLNGIGVPLIHKLKL